MRRFLLLALLAFACRNENSTVGLIRDVAAEARTKPRVQMSVKMSAEQPAPEDLALQKTLEDRIEQAHIGRLVSSKTEAGFVTITVEVGKTADGIEKLRQLARAQGVLERASFRVAE